MGVALDQATLLKAIHHGHDVGRLDAQRGAELARGDARVMGDERQRREVDRPQFVDGHLFQKQADHRQRRTARVVAHQGFQVAGVDRFDKGLFGRGAHVRG